MHLSWYFQQKSVLRWLLGGTYVLFYGTERLFRKIMVALEVASYDDLQHLQYPRANCQYPRAEIPTGILAFLIFGTAKKGSGEQPKQVLF